MVFDPNYRPRLWRDREQARAHYRAVVGLCDTVLATLEDDTGLWGTDTVDESRAFYRDLGVSELVIRAPDLTAHGFAGDEAAAIVAQPVSAIDTTGAGDAFNAGYLAARLHGRDLGASIEAAQALAATVVRHPGAIIPLRANG